MENLKIIWHNQLAEDSFLKFQFLLVKNCENLMNIFESNMLKRFQSLERLDVYDCGSLLLEILEDCIVFFNERIYISALYRRHKCSVQVKCNTSISVLYK